MGYRLVLCSSVYLTEALRVCQVLYAGEPVHRTDSPLARLRFQKQSFTPGFGITKHENSYPFCHLPSALCLLPYDCWTLRFFRAKRCPISSKATSKPVPLPLALA